MSDGPHRTLPMRVAWKSFAKRADNLSFSAEEVAETVCPAIASDWRSEVRPSLLNAIISVLNESTQKELFGGDVDEIDRLRTTCDSPLAAGLCNAAKDALLDGLRGPNAIERAINSTLFDRSIAQIRSIEEHFIRRSNRDRAANVRARLEEAVRGASFSDLVKAISAGASTARRFDPPIRDSLDDGVQLCAR